MEYIKKEDLKDGDVFVSEMSNYHFLNKEGTKFSLDLKTDNTIKVERLIKGSGFSYKNIRLATSEEKHWLNTCIKLDKFITFEEAMKTFIPEYVECIKAFAGITIGKILPVKNNMIIDGTFNNYSIKANNIYNYLKPSTKEAYDAQFVVKEPAENKTELEIWLENTKSLNLSLEDLESYIRDCRTCNYYYIYTKLEGLYSRGKAEILFNKWNKEIIEPLPQFKVIETIETITKVENNEGNQFFIGDTITPIEGFNKGSKFIISGFRYNNAKTNICAIIDTHSPNGIGIDKIEHYIEPKVEVEETLLEKAKRLYPVGTKFKSATTSKLFTVKDHNELHSNSGKNICLNTIEQNEANNYYGCVHSLQGNWAEIVK